MILPDRLYTCSPTVLLQSIKIFRSPLFRSINVDGYIPIDKKINDCLTVDKCILIYQKKEKEKLIDSNLKLATLLDCYLYIYIAILSNL